MEAEDRAGFPFRRRAAVCAGREPRFGFAMEGREGGTIRAVTPDGAAVARMRWQCEQRTGLSARWSGIMDAAWQAGQQTRVGM